MNTLLKYIIPLTLAVGLIGCHKNSKKKGAATSSQQQNGQLMQKPPQSAPEVELSDGEADQFVQAAMNMQEVQIKAQQKMIGIIKDQGLDIKTYQKIARYKHSGDQSASKPDVSDKQMKEYQTASKKIKEAQKGVQKKMAAAINEAGMKKKRFQQISRAVRYDSTLRKTIRTKMKKQAQKKLHPDSSSR